MTLQEKKQQVIEDFSLYEEWLDKYEYLIELGKALPPFPEEKKTEENLIKGCQSRVWLSHEKRDGRIWFEADSDAIITKGIVYLLIKVLSGHTPQEILDNDLSYLDVIGLKNHLSPTRSNGLASMMKQIKLYALAYSAKQ